MSEDRVSITITDGIADVRMTRADKRNALDNAMFAALAAAGERLKTEPGVRVVVLSGEGSSWDVPVHIVSRDPALLKRFTELGFHAGLNPPRKSLGGMHELTALVLRAFAAPHAPATLIAAQAATPAATLTTPGGTAR